MSDKILSHLFSVSDSDILMCVCVLFLLVELSCCLHTICGREMPSTGIHAHKSMYALPCKSFNPYICGALLSYTVVVTCVSLPVLFCINL